jgi:8-oxo-dGTP diphosphatase
MKDFDEKSRPILSVGVILIKNKNEVLLGRRKGPRAAGEYGLPGGFLENNESIDMGALRELDEETGLGRMVMYPVFSLRWSDTNKHYIDFIFLAEHKTGEPVVMEADRVEEWKWCNLVDLPAPLYKPTSLALERFVHENRFHRGRLLLQKWIYRQKRIILFEDLTPPSL